MAKDKLSTSETGIAHLGLILVIVLVLGVTGFAAYNVMSSNSEIAEQDSTSQTADASGEDDSSVDTDSEDDNTVAKETDSDVEAENAIN